jgi:cell shape-determining protein MreD
MNKFFFFLLSVIIVFFQLSVLGVFFDARVIPNVALSFVICLVLLLGIEKSLVWIILVGFLIDIGSAWLWGTSALIFVIASALTDTINKYTEIRSLKSAQMFVLAFVLLFSSFAADFFGIVFSKIESQWIGRNVFYGVSFFSFEYGVKSVAAVATGIVIYYLIRKWNVAHRLSS